VNTTNQAAVEVHNEVVNRTAPGSVRVVNETREVRGVNCNCYGVGGGGYRTSSYGGGAVSYRD
jgi:hypothetical protein